MKLKKFNTIAIPEIQCIELHMTFEFEETGIPDYSQALNFKLKLDDIRDIAERLRMTAAYLDKKAKQLSEERLEKEAKEDEIQKC